MTKKLDTSGIINELRGASPFFPPVKSETTEDALIPATQGPQHMVSEPTEKERVKDGYHETVIPSNHDTTTPDKEDELLEKARKAVKQIGKEAATHRFTLEEKNNLADIEYTYRRQGIRTSENEIT